MGSSLMDFATGFAGGFAKRTGEHLYDEEKAKYAQALEDKKQETWLFQQSEKEKQTIAGEERKAQAEKDLYATKQQRARAGYKALGLSDINADAFAKAGIPSDKVHEWRIVDGKPVHKTTHDYELRKTNTKKFLESKNIPADSPYARSINSYTETGTVAEFELKFRSVIENGKVEAIPTSIVAARIKAKATGRGKILSHHMKNAKEVTYDYIAGIPSLAGTVQKSVDQFGAVTYTPFEMSDDMTAWLGATNTYIILAQVGTADRGPISPQQALHEAVRIYGKPPGMIEESKDKAKTEDPIDKGIARIQSKLSGTGKPGSFQTGPEGKIHIGAEGSIEALDDLDHKTLEKAKTGTSEQQKAAIAILDAIEETPKTSSETVSEYMTTDPVEQMRERVKLSAIGLLKDIAEMGIDQYLSTKGGHDSVPDGRKNATITLQKALVDAGYLSEEDVDGEAGPKTTEALEKFKVELENE